MKISVINGNPKGRHSITLRRIHDLMKKSPEHDVDIIQVFNGVDKIEEDNSLFGEIVDKMVGADAVLWFSHVYYALVPGQLKGVYTGHGGAL